MNIFCKIILVITKSIFDVLTQYWTRVLTHCEVNVAQTSFHAWTKKMNLSIQKENIFLPPLVLTKSGSSELTNDFYSALTLPTPKPKTRNKTFFSFWGIFRITELLNLFTTMNSGRFGSRRNQIILTNVCGAWRHYMWVCFVGVLHLPISDLTILFCTRPDIFMHRRHLFSISSKSLNIAFANHCFSALCVSSTKHEGIICAGGRTLQCMVAYHWEVSISGVSRRWYDNHNFGWSHTRGLVIHH